jgi:hypothetical protein
MGLANLLKRKVTRLKTADKPIQRQNDRSIEEKIAVLAGKNSRTARRKLRQLMGSRSQPLAGDISFPNKGDERSVDSDNSNPHEEGKDVSGTGVHSLADSTGQSAYETLLASLAENNNYISQAYRQRQKELQGDSDVSDSSDSSDYGDRLQNGDFLDHASGDLETNETLKMTLKVTQKMTLKKTLKQRIEKERRRCEKLNLLKLKEMTSNLL